MRSVVSVRVLVALDGAESFSAAAAALGITQSAVSQHVATLERHVGLELVTRGSRPVELTRAGRVLAEHGAAVADRLTEAQRDLDALAGRHHRHLRVGGFPTALATVVPRAIRQVAAAVPDARIDIVDDHLQGLLPRLLERRLDVCLVFDDPSAPTLPGADRGIELTTLFTDSYRLLVPGGHRLAKRAAAPRLTELADERWVGGTPSSTWFSTTRTACRAVGFEPNVALTSDDYLAVQSFVAAGLGIAVVPGLVAARRIPGVVARELSGGAPARVVGVARPMSAFRPHASDAMIEALRAATVRFGTDRRT